ncbi:MAG: hypothetical protein WC817_00825 [Patescibacteria group bacterium]|jgi:hypothetical protein
MKRNPVIVGLASAVAVTVYVGLVASLLFNGEQLFGSGRSFVIPFTMLLLFVLSAAVVGSLVLGRPVYLYFEGQKKEGIALLISTIIWLFVFTFTALLVNFVIN